MKLNYSPLLPIILLLASISGFAQVTNNLQQPTSINTDGATPVSSAILDVQSTTHGMLVPRMTTAQRTAIASPAAGLLVFDTTTGGFWFYNGAWQSLSGGGGGGDDLGNHQATQDLDLGANAIVNLADPTNAQDAATKNYVDSQIGSGGPSTSVADADGDTQIQTEETADEDMIRFEVDNNEAMVIDNVGSVGIGTDSPALDALFELSSNEKGILIPRMSSGERMNILAPSDGLLVFDTDEASFWYFNNEKWLGLTTAVQPGEFVEKSETLSIPDNNSGGISSVITLTQTGTVQSNTQFEVFIYGTHSRHQDLDITLSSPDGTTIDLASDIGLTGGPIVVYFTTNATTSVTTPSLPRLIGTFSPEEPFSAFSGKTIAGDWTLNIVDDQAGAIGFFYRWSIRMVESGPTLNILSDKDADTKIEVEQIVDEDVIRLTSKGSERMTINSDSTVISGKVRLYGSFVAGSSSNNVLGSNSSVSGGLDNTASNQNAHVGGGQNNVASGNSASVSGGFGNEASGAGSFVSGSSSTSSGAIAASLGVGLLARSYSETVFGTYNADYTPTSTSSIEQGDRLFVIGNGTGNAAGNRSNAVTVLKNGNFGIGAYGPSEKLVVNGNILTDASGDFYTDSSNGVFNIGGGVMNDEVNIISDNTPTLNNVNGDEDLYIQDDLELGSQGYKPGGGTWATASDSRLKKDIQPYQDGLAQVMQIKPVRFRYNEIPDFPEPEREYVGIIAQDMLDIAPYMVEEMPFGQKTTEDENGVARITEPGTPYYTYDGTALTYMLVNAVQEQQAILETKTGEINTLHAALQRQQKEMEHATGELRAELSALKAALEKVTSSTTD